MQLKVTTDYAVRTVLYLSMIDRLADSNEIAERMGIPRNYLANIVGIMKRAGFVNTVSGAGGGYRLAKPPEEITLLDIVKAMEGTIKVNRCLEDDHVCVSGDKETCPVRKVYAKFQDMMEDYFQSVTIADMLQS